MIRLMRKYKNTVHQHIEERNISEYKVCNSVHQKLLHCTGFNFMNLKSFCVNSSVCRSMHVYIDIKMGSCVSQCDVPHQWIAQ